MGEAAISEAPLVSGNRSGFSLGLGCGSLLGPGPGEEYKCRRCDLRIILSLDDFDMLGMSRKTIDKLDPAWHLTCYAIGELDDIYWHNPLALGEDKHNAVICAMCAARE